MTEVAPSTNTASSISLQLLQTLAHVFVFLCFQHAVFAIGMLPEFRYQESVLLVAALKHWFATTSPWLLLIAVPLLWKTFHAGWDAHPSLILLRWPAFGLAFALAMTFGCQEGNLFFHQDYQIDRYVLIGMSAMVILRPFFILPFVIHVIVVGGQFSHPIPGYEWDGHLLGIYRLPIHLLLIILTGLVFAGQNQNRTQSRYCSTMILSLVVIAAGYWVPGITKLRIGWATVPNIHYSLFGAWCHGWLSGMKPERVASLTNFISLFSVPLQCLTVLMECGAILIVWRRVSVVLLAAWILFHIGVFALYGYAFWLWILIDLGALILIVRNTQTLRDFQGPHVLLAALLIGTSSRWLNPNRLAWFNTPLVDTYQFVATTNTGSQVELTPGFFAPYEYIFTMNWFGFVSDRRQLTGPYGAATDSRLAFLSAGELTERYDKLEAVEPDPVLTHALSRFLTAYLKNWNSSRSTQTFLTRFKPPTLLLTTRRQANIPPDQFFVSVEVWRIRSLLLENTVERKVVERCLVVAVPPE